VLGRTFFEPSKFDIAKESAEGLRKALRVFGRTYFEQSKIDIAKESAEDLRTVVSALNILEGGAGGG